MSGWSRQIFWGNNRVRGGVLTPGGTAWARRRGVGLDARRPARTSSGARTASTPSLRQHRLGQQHRVGRTTDADDNIVWGNTDGDNIVWGNGDDDNIVWGNGDDDNIVWGNDCGGADCDNIVWGNDGDDNIVWGNAEGIDNIVWGNSDDDNIVWGNSDDDNIVWGNSGDDNIVWGNSDRQHRLGQPSPGVPDRLRRRDQRSEQPARRAVGCAVPARRAVARGYHDGRRADYPGDQHRYNRPRPPRLRRPRPRLHRTTTAALAPVTTTTIATPTTTTTTPTTTNEVAVQETGRAVAMAPTHGPSKPLTSERRP